MWGSAASSGRCSPTGLVDELNLMIEPILLGGGKRIFPDDGVPGRCELVKLRHRRHRRAGRTYQPA